MESLKAFPVFAGLSDEECARIDSQCSWRTYEPRAIILDHNEPSTDVRFILFGSVRIVVRMMEGREVIFNDFGEGRFFGELSAIDDGARSANVTAVTRARICIMPQSVFRQVCTDHSLVSMEVMKHLAGMVRMLSERLSEFSFLKAKHRLFAELLRLSRERKGAVAEGVQQRIISPAPVQSDIADRISSRREIVSREMKELERQAILERTRGGLVILDPDKLGRLAAEGWFS
ncbi:Crp/Fnr family transcriptional regulator [Ahrensia sp. R2A130]|uniref:Crp/Fnr family transcriptional regulator n=1 Tax=Ahrensia sp. R2A130 TaxID=744979 RepID=UPI0001E0E89F|nr:Crp/Fnr family transcriptional regulator [Ahrensia sp. R2A130]EFL89357.1 cyclic nucleotide-binding protein [Ahrensia sp. R2A130]